MSEPLLFGTTFLAVALVAGGPASSTGGRTVRADAPALRVERASATTTAPGWALVAACLTRYEAWPITAAAIGLAWSCSSGEVGGCPTPFAPFAGSRCGRCGRSPHFSSTARSRWAPGSSRAGFSSPRTRRWVIPGWRGSRSGPASCNSPVPVLPWSACAAAGLTILGVPSFAWPGPLIVALALSAAALLPWYAYLQGHPVRLRYDVPLVAAVRRYHRPRCQPAAAASAPRRGDRYRRPCRLAGESVRRNRRRHQESQRDAAMPSRVVP